MKLYRFETEYGKSVFETVEEQRDIKTDPVYPGDPDWLPNTISENVKEGDTSWWTRYGLAKYVNSPLFDYHMEVLCSLNIDITLKIRDVETEGELRGSALHIVVPKALYKIL